MSLSRRHALDLPDTAFHQTLGRLVDSLRRDETQARAERGRPAREPAAQEGSERERLAIEAETRDGAIKQPSQQMPSRVETMPSIPPAASGTRFPRWAVAALAGAALVGIGAAVYLGTRSPTRTSAPAVAADPGAALSDKPYTVSGWSITSRVLVQPGTGKVYISDDRDQKDGAVTVSEGHASSRIRLGAFANEGAPSSPQDMVFDPAAAERATQRPFLYVADAEQNTIHVVDLNRKVEVAVLTTQRGTKVRSLTITPDSRKLFVSNEGSIPNGTISVFDVSDLSVRYPNAFRRLPDIGGFGCAEGLAIAPNGRELYVSTQCGGGQDPVYIIDTAQDKVIASITGLAVGGKLAVSPDGRQLYVARSNYRCAPRGIWSPFSIVDVQSRRIESTVCVEAGSVNFIAITPDGKYLLVPYDNKLSVFDAKKAESNPDNALLNTIDLESPVAGIGVGSDDSVYAWIPAIPRIFSFKPSGLTQ